MDKRTFGYNDATKGCTLYVGLSDFRLIAKRAVANYIKLNPGKVIPDERE